MNNKSSLLVHRLIDSILSYKDFFRRIKKKIEAPMGNTSRSGFWVFFFFLQRQPTSLKDGIVVSFAVFSISIVGADKSSFFLSLWAVDLNCG